jgi:hypothetical protein
MQINRNNLQHITTVQHQGLVFLFGIDTNRDIYYAVRQTPLSSTQSVVEEEEMDPSDPSDTIPDRPSQWGEWVRLPLPADQPDESVIQREREERTNQWVRSQYNTAHSTALAPIQVLSDGEHLLVFRQSLDNTLLVDRFLLDGGTERLVPKLEVRFKRSRQRFAPAQPQGLGGSRSFDTTDFRDFEGNFFFEPTQEIRLAQNLTAGWFSVVLTHTTEHNVSRWHIFAHNRETGRIELFSIRRSGDRLFDLADYTLEEGTVEDPQPRQIPGLIKRTLILRDEAGDELTPTDAPTATRFCLQSEMTTQDGDLSFIKGGVRVMLAVPVRVLGATRDTTATLASLIFGVRTDGTLAQIDDLPQESLLLENNRDILLPADVLQRVRGVRGNNQESELDTNSRPSFTFDGVDDYIDVGSDRTLNFARNFSIEAWVWPAVNKEQWIFAKQDSYGLGLVNGNPVFVTYNGERYLMENVSIPPNTWTHLAMVLDRRNTLNVYVNGELADTYEGVTPAQASAATAKIGVQDPESGTGFWEGWLANVRVWNVALTEAEIQQRQHIDLLGREIGLVGYWPLMSLANGETVDFSLESNTGRVFGAFPTGRRLERQVGRRNAQVYRYSEVFNVVQGATYLETFEYRTDESILPFDEVAEAFNFVFEGRRGGRNGEPTEPVSVPAQIRPLAGANDDGWRLAQARFTVPEGMTHLRYFHITPPGGTWNTLEIRRHRMEQLSRTVTQAEFVDDVMLPALADSFASLEDDLDRLPPLEQEEVSLIERVRFLETQLSSDNPEQVLRDAIANQRSRLRDLDGQVRNATNRLDRALNDPFHRYAAIPVNPIGTGLNSFLVLRDATRPSVTVSGPLGDFPEDWQWGVVRTGIDPNRGDTNIFLVQIHHRSSERLLLTAGISADRQRYDQLQVRPRANSTEFVQTWQMEFIGFGQQATVRLRTSTPNNPTRYDQMLVLAPIARIRIVPEREALTQEFTTNWGLLDFDNQPGGNLHPSGRRLIAEITNQRDALIGDRDRAREALNRLEQDLVNQGSLEEARAALAAVQVQMASIRTRYLQAITALTNQSQEMPIIPTTGGGTVQGALLGFATPVGVISAYESVEAAVYLNFFDRRGRLRTLPYNAIDEAWQPALPGTAVELQAGASPAQVVVSNFGTGAIAALGLTALTWEGWLRTSEPNAPGTIVDYVAEEGNWQISNPANVQVTINGETTPAQNINLADGRWHHLAFTWQSQAGQLHLYVDGLNRYSGHVAQNSMIPLGGTLRLGTGETEAIPFLGYLSEVRIWNQGLGADEIQANQHFLLTGREPGLLSYWSMNDVGRDTILDRSPNGYHGTPSGQISFVPDTAPLGQIERDTDSTLVIVNEYPTQETDETGQAVALMRRFYAYIQSGAFIETLQDQRIESLEVRWVGNAQFEPTLLGYIESAPPVPSENLTLSDSYDNASAVQLTSTENVTYSWTRSEDIGIGFDLEAILGTSLTVEVGLLVTTSVEAGIGLTGSLSGSYSLLDEGTTTLDVANIFQDRLALRGEQESVAQFPHLGRRYVPKNVGYALVVSSLADVFVLRLQRSRRMVSYQIAPVPDLPPQVNTITFLVNPAYIQNGTLDGQIGTSAADERFFGHVPEMRSQFGSQVPASYFRIQEAAQLQAELQRQDREREALFFNYNSRAVNFGAINRVSGDINEDNVEEVTTEAGVDIESGFDDITASRNTSGWQRRLEQLRVQARKRNIVNTYIWDADGGLRSESQEFADTIEQTIGGSFSLDASLGITNILKGAGVWFELTALATASLTQISTKTERRSRGFSLDVQVDGESRGVTRANDTAVIPGEKVDRYRFSSFYLEPDTDHFDDFFHQVVDPEWLMSNDEEAHALRQISMVRPNPVWRVKHLVTFVERPVLQGVGSVQQTLAPAVEQGIPQRSEGNGRRTVTADVEG